MNASKTTYSNKRLKDINRVRWITITALFLGLTIAVSSFGIPVPGGHLYLVDTVICTAALLLDPLASFVVGGIGSCLGDMIFYPAPMFVSLATHGLQAIVISLMVSKVRFSSGKKYFSFSLLATLIGMVIMVTGYTLGKIFVYSNLETAILKLPYEIAQGLLGVIGSLLLCFKGGLIKIFKRMEMN